MSKNVTVIPPSEKRPDTLRVAAYCRVSSDSSDQLHSYAAQIRKYTEEIGQPVSVPVTVTVAVFSPALMLPV